MLFAPIVASGEESFEVSLSGSEVSGDPDGRGEATVTVNPETKQIDVQLSYSNIAEPTAVHIREGATGTDGNVVANFAIESRGQGSLTATGTAKEEAYAPMLASPERYYLVVLNGEHVVGALRGPLGE